MVRRSTQAQLVEPVVRIDEDGVARSASLDDPRHLVQEGELGNTDERALDECGVGEGAEHVEHRAKAEGASNRREVSERVVIARREQESEPRHLDAGAHHFDGRIESNTERLEQIRRTHR